MISASAIVTASASWISVLVYGLVLIVLFRWRKEDFQSPFYPLFMSLGLADIITISHQYLLNHFVTWGTPMATLFLANPHGILPRLQTMGNLYMAQNQFLGVVNLTANRFSAIVFPLSYNTAWKPKIVVICMLVQWIVPLLFVSPLFGTGFMAEQNNVTKVVLVHYDDMRYLLVYWIFIAFGDGVILNVIMGAAYSFMFYKSFKQNHHMAAARNENEQSRRAERNLALTGLFIFVAMLVYGVLTVLVILSIGTGTGVFMFSVWQFWVEVFSWMNVWAILCTSSVVRKKFREAYLCFNPNAVVPVNAHDNSNKTGHVTPLRRH